MAATPEHTAAATRILRGLLGGRFTWPPMRVVDRYPVSGRGRVRLASSPVRQVHSVTLVQGGSGVVTFEQAGRTLHLNLGQTRFCPADDQIVEVDYEFGNRPSGEIQKAIGVLAAELDLAENDDPNCRIPDRVTSVSRQGVSWTLIDPQDFLTDGRTGIYEIDLALRANGTSRARAIVFSPAFEPPDRRSVEQLEEPA